MKNLNQHISESLIKKRSMSSRVSKELFTIELDGESFSSADINEIKRFVKQNRGCKVATLSGGSNKPYNLDEMFRYCESLVSVNMSDLDLSNATTYKFMFGKCTKLTKAPELPATELADSCYYGMFQGCSNLTKAPELPATELVIRCYDNMFNGCSKLKNNPLDK